MNNLDTDNEFEDIITMTNGQSQSIDTTDTQAPNIKNNEQKSQIQNIRKQLDFIYSNNNKQNSKNAICSFNLDVGNYLKKLFCCS